MWGNVPKGQKGKASFKNGGQAALLNRRIDSIVLKSKREPKRTAIAFKNEKVVMRNKVSGAIAVSQASWGCAPALPNRIWVVFLEESCHPSADSEAILPILTQSFFLEIGFRCLL